ncbi:DNA replication endonuclease-helicase Dna2 [Microbotryomycetes sp. JL201]|nr:DNA replication endonuclease-helicase Dna2 [Microbotryomycetes sp. JL201]
MAVDHDFMQELFADLDSSAFDTTDLSSPPPKHAASQPSLPLKPAARTREPQHGLRGASKARDSRPQQPSQTSKTDNSRPAPFGAQGQFWDDPYTRPIIHQKIDPTLATAAPAALRGPASATKSASAHGASRTVRRLSAENRSARAVKYVAIAADPPSPNATYIGGKDKDKRKNELDALVGGIDWDAEDWQATPPPEESDQISDSDKPKLKPPALSQQFTRCNVTNIQDSIDDQTRRPYRILTIECQAHEKPCNVHVCDDWLQTTVQIGDTINLIGNLESHNDPALVVDRNNGMLILHPDILVSSTKVGDSANCARKAVLQELIRTIGGSNKSLVYGNMLHELMQSCMLENSWDESYRRDKIQEIIRNQIQQLWSIDLESTKAYEDMVEKSKGFDTFKATFINTSNVPRATAIIQDSRADKAIPSKLAITEALSVEEDIWSPKYGLKGKIDVSVSGVVATNNVERKAPATMPFEIKTGRTNAGMEHRAQTMLYTLLMSDRYSGSLFTWYGVLKLKFAVKDEEIASGLLYYSQSNSVVRVQAARNELRGLILARNEFATFLHRRTTISPFQLGGLSQSSQPDRTTDRIQDKSRDTVVQAPALVLDDDEEAMWAAAGGYSIDSGFEPDIEDEPRLLPIAIDDTRICKRCYTKDACMLFRSAVDGDNIISNDPESELQADYEEKTGFLTQEHKSFFKHWERLVSLEEQDVVRHKKEIWTMSAEDRMKAGRQVSEGLHSDHQWLMVTASQHAAHSLLGGAIKVNDPITVSLEEPYVLGVARGFVLELDARSIVLGLDRPLETTPQAARALPPSTQPQDLIFRVDEDELAAGLGRLRDNLIQLFVANGDERRRRLVVDLAPPEFEPGLLRKDETVRDRFISNQLNPDQKAAVEKVLSARDYALILGMPGTGKTTAIAEIVKTLAKCGKSVLLTAYTHSAVDNVLLKLEDSTLSVLRLGNRDKIMPQLHSRTLDTANMPQTLTQVDNLLMMPQVVATTTSNINEPIFTKRRFDVCIVDEASQVTLPACLGPLRFADTFVLVGDHNQLPPLVRNKVARQSGLDVSLFKRLSDAHPEAVCNLSLQYRMNKDIMLLSNRLIYENRLKCGSSVIAERKLSLQNKDGLKGLADRGLRDDTGWLETVVDPDRAVVFLNTDEIPALEHRAGSRAAEALLKCGVKPVDVGVITPYRQQLKLLSRKLEHVSDVEVLTADRSQGRDKECIIMSLVRSNEDKVVGDLLKDWRRINVCLTRAKSKIIIIGSRSTLTNLPLLAKFFQLVDERNWQTMLPKRVAEWIPGCVLGSNTKLKRISSPADVINIERSGDDKENLLSTPDRTKLIKVRRPSALPFSSSPLMLRDSANIA